MAKVQFKSPTEFALYVQDRFLKPYFVFEEVDDGVPNVRRSIAKLKPVKPMDLEEIYNAYKKIKKEIYDLAEEKKHYYWNKENFKDFKGYFQQGNLYFNSNCLIYIKSFEDDIQGRRKLLIYLLNLYYIKEGAHNMGKGDAADIWMNSYHTYTNRILDNSSEGLFFRVPLERLRGMQFMNWETDEPWGVEK